MSLILDKHNVLHILSNYLDVPLKALIDLLDFINIVTILVQFSPF